MHRESGTLSSCLGNSLIWLSVICLFVNRIDALIAVNARLVGKRALGGHQNQLILKDSLSDASVETTVKLKNDWSIVLLHLGVCLLSSLSLCMYEEFDCRNLKPNLHLRQHAVRGMGEGYSERMLDWRQGDILVGDLDTSLLGIPSYNELLQRHREHRIPSWGKTISEQEVRVAVHNIFEALAAINTLKSIADDYRWVDLQNLIRAPVLSDSLEESCSVLRRASFALSQESRNEIGFDWGSCAWRHCGAEADAQEALAELFNLSGILEPFECRFVLDVVERCLRDILAVVPIRYYDRALETYEPYQFKDTSDGSSWQDMELLRAITEFRSSPWDDE